MLTTNTKIVIFYFGTFLPTANGSHVRFASMLDRLASEFQNLTLYTYQDHPDCPWDLHSEAAFRDRWPGVELIIESYTSKLRYSTRVKNLLISLFPDWADRLIRIALPGASPKFDTLKASASLFFVSYTEGLAQLNGVEPSRCFVETHDVNFVKWAKLNETSPISLVPLRKLRGEIAALDTVRGVIAISPAETSLFRMMLRATNVSYVPSWDLPAPVQARSEQPTDFDLVFAGSEYIMNVRGLVDMFRAHGEWLSKFRIAICGRVCDDPAVINAAASFPNVSLLGFVDRVEDIYLRSKAALAPVDGTGMKMKVVSALAAGLPVFASAQSLEGLPAGYEEAIFEIGETQVDSILSDIKKLRQASLAALRYDRLLKMSGDLPALLSTVRSSSNRLSDDGRLQ